MGAGARGGTAGAAGDGLVVGLLGPVEVASPGGGGLAGVGRPMLRVLVAMLAVAGGRVVPVEALVDGLWGEEWSREREQNLHTHISALRRLLAAGQPERDGAQVVRSGGGYRLVAAETEVDAGLFGALAGQGREAARAGEVAGAAGLFTQALGLWRGAALADVVGLCPRLVGDAAGLEEARAGVVEERLECDLALGRHTEVAAEGPGLVAAFPLRERLAGQVMVALYRCGRRGEALAVFDTTRRVLAEQLGLDPGPQLAQIQAQILADDPTLTPAQPPATAAVPGGPQAGAAAGTGDASPESERSARPREVVVPRQLPAGVGYFAGRVGELKALDELVGQPGDPAGAGAVVVTAVGGMAGVGKTALAVHWAGKIAGRFPDGQLYVNLRGYDPEEGPLASEVVTGWFLAALGITGPAIPADAQARAGLYRSVLADRRVLIVLDNARDAAQVRPLLVGGPGCLAIVTSRSSLAGLAATDGARLVPLGLLDQEEAIALLAARLGPDRMAAEPDAVQSLVSMCGGLPLALAIIAARAAETPDLPLASLAAGLAGESSRLDALDCSDEASSARAVFSWSLRYLSDAATRMFVLLGVHCGPDISTAAAASLAGIPSAEARTALAELASASLAREYRPGRYVLHDLLRAYAAEQATHLYIDTEIRAAVGRSLDHYLHTMAGMVSFRAAAFPLAPPRPGVGAEQLTDDSDLLAWLHAEHPVLRQAVEQAADTGFDTEAWQAAFFLGFSANWQGKWADWDATAQTALAVTTRAGDQTGLGWTHYQLANLHGVLGAHGEALAQSRLALVHFQQADDLTGQAFAHEYISRTLLDPEFLDELRSSRHRHEISSLSPELRRSFDESLGHARTALELHRQSGNQRQEAMCLGYIGGLQAVLGAFEQALETCQHALDLSRQISDPACESEAWGMLGIVHLLRGEFDIAVNSHQNALQVLDDVGPRYAQTRAVVLTDLGYAHDAAGDRQAARQAWGEALQILDDFGHPRAEHLRTKLGLGSGH